MKIKRRTAESNFEDEPAVYGVHMMMHTYGVSDEEGQIR